MKFEDLDSEDKKYFTKKLIAISGKLAWSKLTPSEQKDLIETYCEEAGFEHLEPRELIWRVRDRRLSILVLVMGVFLGVIGGLFATVLHEWLKNLGLPYYIGVLCLGVFVFASVWQLPEWVANENLKEGKLFEKLKKISRERSNTHS